MVIWVLLNITLSIYPDLRGKPRTIQYLWIYGIFDYCWSSDQYTVMECYEMWHVDKMAAIYEDVCYFSLFKLGLNSHSNNSNSKFFNNLSCILPLKKIFGTELMHMLLYKNYPARSAMLYGLYSMDFQTWNIDSSRFLNNNVIFFFGWLSFNAKILLLIKYYLVTP